MNDAGRMQRIYLAATVYGLDENGVKVAAEEVLYEEGQDPLVLAFRRNGKLAACTRIRMEGPEVVAAETVTMYRHRTPESIRETARQMEEQEKRKKAEGRWVYPVYDDSGKWDGYRRSKYGEGREFEHVSPGMFKTFGPDGGNG